MEWDSHGESVPLLGPFDVDGPCQGVDVGQLDQLRDVRVRRIDPVLEGV